MNEQKQAPFVLIQFDMKFGFGVCVCMIILTLFSFFALWWTVELKCCIGCCFYVMQVTSAFGNSYHSSENVQSGQFAFQAVEAGDYMTCFFAIDHQPPLKIPIDFDWKSGVAAKDWSNVAKKGSLDVSRFILSIFLSHIMLCICVCVIICFHFNMKMLMSCHENELTC